MFCLHFALSFFFVLFCFFWMSGVTKLLGKIIKKKPLSFLLSLHIQEECVSNYKHLMYFASDNIT